MRLLLAVGAVAAGLRLTALGYGLPDLFNADEPHIINVAASFGRGSLNPGIFKYPTLWMYLLFAAFGIHFLAWSRLGTAHSVREFGQRFIWDNASFYLVGRALSAAFSMAGLAAVYAAGAELGGRRTGLWAAAFLAGSVWLVEAAHAAKADSIMFFFAALAWLCALRYRSGGRPRQLLAAAVFAGLAASSQYTGAPAALLVPLAWLMRRRAQPGGAAPALLAVAMAVVPAAFLLATPFALLDAGAFRRDLLDLARINTAGQPYGLRVLLSAAAFAGPAWLGGPALILGAGTLARRDPALAGLLLAPPLALLAVLSFSDKGSNMRYLFSVMPALAILAGSGVDAAAALLRLPLERAAVRAAVLAVVLLPGLAEAVPFVRRLSLPDTRQAAEAWLAQNLAPGTRVLTGDESNSPTLRMSLEQARSLLAATKAAGHPRWRYYELMVQSHPGGGYEVWRMRRDPVEITTGFWHRRWSESGRATLDVSAGLEALKAPGVEVVVFANESMDHPSPGIARLVAETVRSGRLLAQFKPEPGRVKGPDIFVYRVAERR